MSHPFPLLHHCDWHQRWGLSPDWWGWYHAAVLVVGQQLFGTGRSPISEAEELFLSPNVNKKLPAVEMIPVFFCIRGNHHSSRLTSSFVVMETQP